MKIIRKSVWEWTGTAYVKVYQEDTDWRGPVALACGATGAQTNIEQSQQNFMTQLQTQAGAVFGNSSQVFSSLMSTFAPTVAAGPNQQGFSPALLSSLNSQAITQTGQAYQNAKAALGNQMSAVDGGNSALPSGTQAGEELGLAESGANQTASELQQITQENYATGRQNYEQAVAGEEAAPNVFGAATGAGNAATSAGSAAASTANQIATQQNSWMQPVIGALGAAAGVATGGLTNGLMAAPGPNLVGQSLINNAQSNGMTAGNEVPIQDPGTSGYIGG